VKFLSSLLIVFIFVGCGYKPSVKYTRKVLGERIHVNVSISRKDPKNSVLIKDAVNEAVIGRFGASLSDEKSADTNLYVTIGSTSFTPTAYDADGYVISYKAKVTLKTKYTTKTGKTKSFTTIGEYDFPIEANSVISDTKRFEAIKYASMDAINEIISKIAIIGQITGGNNFPKKERIYLK